MTPEKVSIGILVYQGKKYLDFLIPSLLAQDYPNLEILVLDNASPENDAETIRMKWPQVRIFRNTENSGFAGGHNFLIRKMSGTYYLCLNQDIFLESDFVSKLMQTIQQEGRVGAVSGKLYRWDFPKGLEGKTEIIDTVGIKAFASQRFIDKGQGEDDCGQYQLEEEIFAPSGAAALYRLEALEEVAYLQKDQEKEYFDELFFMYKEDIDLGYRLHWAGWKALYTPEAKGYHDRTVTQKKPGILGMLAARKTKSFQNSYLSWRNYNLLLEKNFSPGFSRSVKWKTFWYRLAMALYLRIYEPAVFLEAKNFLREKLPRKTAFKISPAKLERIFV